MLCMCLNSGTQNVLDEICDPGPLFNDEVLKPPTISKATVQRCISKLSPYWSDEQLDQVMAGSWAWPDPDGLDANADDKLSPATLEKLVLRLRGALIGETIVESTWKGSYSGYFQKLIEVAGQQRWQSEPDLLEQTLRTWEPNSRSRQIGHDRLRRLWREAGWDWPDAISKMRGNGKAAAPTEGVRAFSDAEVAELRA